MQRSGATEVATVAEAAPTHAVVLAEPTKTPAEIARNQFLEQSARTLGQTWARRWREDLRLEGRPAAGGWPGTLREARAHVQWSILAEMTRRRMPAITEAERELAARTAYASARCEWRKHLEPEGP
jgi:hypothetical protein